MRIEKILVVDDEPEVLKLLGVILKKQGYRPVTCLTGREAIEQIQKKNFLLGLFDILLPDMDGLEVLKEAKKRNPLAEMIVMTGCDRIDVAIKAIKYQASDFLLKPIEPELLYCSLNRAKEVIGLRLKDLLSKKNLERIVNKRTQQLIHAEKQAIIGNSVQGVVHNILNPLTVIAGRAELLKTEIDQLDRKDSREQAGRGDVFTKEILESLDRFGQDIYAIYQNSQKIFQIADNILKKSSMERENISRSIDINNLIIQEMEFFKSDLFFKHQVKKTYDLDQSLEKVNMVYSHLSQVLDNLIKNAIEAMYDSKEKEIAIKTYQDEEWIYIAVKDTGAGIPDHLKDKVFEPFFSTKSVSEDGIKKHRIGYGLGLHSCLELLRLYSGDILLESRPDIGSTLTIVLPRSIASDAKTDSDDKKSKLDVEKQSMNTNELSLTQSC
jgi:signal transduction histidine kinase